MWAVNSLTGELTSLPPTFGCVRSGYAIRVLGDENFESAGVGFLVDASHFDFDFEVFAEFGGEANRDAVVANDLTGMTFFLEGFEFAGPCVDEFLVGLATPVHGSEFVLDAGALGDESVLLFGVSHQGFSPSSI